MPSFLKDYTCAHIAAVTTTYNYKQLRMHQSIFSQLTDKRQNLSDALSTVTSPNSSSYHRHHNTTPVHQFGQLFYQFTPSTTIKSTRVEHEKMEQSKKRTRRVLSLKERIEVIRIAETRRDTRELAAKFDCGRTQILSILSQKERLLREWANNGDPNRLRRRPSPIAITTNKVIYEWINRCKRAQVPLSEDDILKKAYAAKQMFKYSEFRPNRRWLERFKRKFKIDLDELLTPNPILYDGIERSLALEDIYKDIKHSSLVHGGDDEIEFHMDSIPGSGECLSLENMMNYDQTMSSSNNDVCEIYDSDDNPNSEESNSKSEDDDKPITNDEQALSCLKRLEEYSMLKDNYRAIGLIGQLEKIYMGQIES